jgi:hypothetical protein
VVQASRLGVYRAGVGVFRGRSGALALLFLAGSIGAAIAQSSHGEANQASTIHPLRTALHSGLCSYIIAIPKEKERTITILNQNAAAEGRFSIAIANRQLPADSPHWSVVGGAINFRHQRRFAFSLDGIEAKYVRLTFDVLPPHDAARSR